MEHTLDEPVGLNSNQIKTLDEIVRHAYFLNTFYLSGGTALSSWYLHHRESYDLDFFSDQPFDYEKIMRWFRQSEKTLEYETIRFDDDYGFLICYLRFPDNSILKVDFNNYAASRIKRGFTWKGLSIDSIYDISVNKLRTIAVFPRTRDYVDLYCILQQYSYSINTLLDDVNKKFREEVDLLQLTKNFLKVEELTDMPIMLVPFERGMMIQFYQKLSQSFKSSIFN